MAIKQLKETAKSIPDEIESVVQSQVEYYKLYAFRIFAKSATGLVALFVMSLFALAIVFFLANAMAFALGEWLKSTALGFLIIGLVLFLVAFCIYKFRAKIIYKPILEKISNIYFTKD
ncbi:MAG: hypothetical protein Q3983_01660 [Capnocytophaga sp.]|nr:hypothetical protein [Capnocytophaga sp.]